MLGADDVELLLDFLLMTEAELVSGGGEREVAGGVLTRARERVAEWLCALCEARLGLGLGLRLGSGLGLGLELEWLCALCEATALPYP